MARPAATERPPGRREAEAQATRDALVQAALELFAERGYAAVGTEEIVARARVTRGALYHHFEDKRDLFRAVHERVEGELMERVTRAHGGHRRSLGADGERACGPSSRPARSRR